MPKKMLRFINLLVILALLLPGRNNARSQEPSIPPQRSYVTAAVDDLAPANDYYRVAEPGAATISAIDDSASGSGAGCTLRDALAVVNAGLTAGVVNGCEISTLGAPAGRVYQVQLPPGSYTYTLAGQPLLASANTVYIVGESPQNSLLQAASQPGVATTRVLEIQGFATRVTLEHLAIRNGVVDGGFPDGAGGGILSGGSLTVNDCSFSNNRVEQEDGGAIWHEGQGDLLIATSSFYDNTAGGAGGAIYSAGDSNSQVSVNSSLFENNVAETGGGGAINNGESVLRVADSYFATNRALGGFPNNGGAISNNGGSATITNTIFNWNTSMQGGAITNKAFGTGRKARLEVHNCTFTGNGAAQEGGGGAIQNSPFNDATGVITITWTTFTENYAGKGGAISTFGDLDSAVSVSGSIFKDNRATQYGGGAISSSGKLAIVDSEFSGNQAPANMSGGALELNVDDGYPALTTLDATTISGNSAGLGAAISNQGALTITNATIVDNKTGGGLLQGGNSGENTLVINNTIIAHNEGGDCFGWNNPAGSGGANIILDNACQVAASQEDPKVKPLAENGGFTMTHALQPDSKAIDAGDPAHCSATDQRGYPRSVDGNGDGQAGCDIGAYEAGANPREPMPILLDQLVTGQVDLLGYADYQLAVTGGQALLVEVLPGQDTQALAVYSRLAQLPTWKDFDQAGAMNPLNGAYELVIAPTQAGTYFISVYGTDVAAEGGSFSLRVSLADQAITGISPTTAANGAPVTLNLSGVGFVEGLQVSLQGNNLPAIVANRVTWVSRESIWATVDLAGVPARVYDVVATWPGGAQELLPGAFAVTSQTAASGPNLVVNLRAPAQVRPGRQYVLWVDYANTGDQGMVAPLFVISNNVAAPMSLNPQAAFQAGAVQALGISQAGPAGELAAGETASLPVYFQTPVNMAAHQRIDFHLNVMDSADNLIDWAAVEAQVKPPDANPLAWQYTWENFKASIGDSWPEYAQALANQATYLAQLGNRTASVVELVSQRYRAANGHTLTSTLASSTDGYAATPGIAMVFKRQLYNSLESRFWPGVFGRGWSHSYEISLTAPDTGTVIICGPGGAGRRFTRGVDGTWRGGTSDFATLTETGTGQFMLREKDGQEWYFNPTGQLIYRQDRNGNRLTFTYQPDGRLTAISHTNGQSFTFDYNNQGRLWHFTDQANQVTTYGYDASGELLLSVVAPGNLVTSYSYQPVGNTPGDYGLSAIAYPDGSHQFYAYDAQGRLESRWQDGETQRVTYRYEPDGTVIETGANGARTSYVMGGPGIPLQIIDPLGQRLGIMYDVHANPVRVIQPDGSETALVYDGRGNLTELKNPLNQSTRMGYWNDFNRLAYLVDASHRRFDFTYDLFGNLTKITYPDGSAELVGHDLAGNLTSHTNRRGETITYQYDSLGRLIGKTYPSGQTIQYTYDVRGYLQSAIDSISGAIQMEYDNRGYLIKISYQGGRWFTFEYDPAGRRTRRVGQDGFAVNYVYDAAGRLYQLTDGNGADIITYLYDVNGRLATETKANGTVTTYQYDLAGQLIELVNSTAGGEVQSFFHYAYDVNGNRVGVTSQEGTTSYAYDVLGQLIRADTPDGKQVAFSYDAVGNRTAVVADGLTTPYLTNVLNEYQQVGSTLYSYDADGNLIGSQNGVDVRTYEYDIENRLVKAVASGGLTWEYQYDGLGNRNSVKINGITTNYVSDPQGLVDLAAEYDASGNLQARYLYGAGLVARMEAGGGWYYYAYDASGNTRQLTNASGLISNTYQYDPFGGLTQVNETVANPFRFVGRFGVQQDGTGMNFMRARYYQPDLGRFTTIDRIRFNSGNPNLYSYSNNHPIGLIDPTGLKPWSELWFTWLYIRTSDPQNTGSRDCEHYAYAGIMTGEDKHNLVFTDFLVIGYSLYKFLSFLPLWTDATYPSLNEISAGMSGAYQGTQGFKKGGPCDPPEPPPPPPPPPGPQGDDTHTETVLPEDPNAMVGPAGWGSERLVTRSETLIYTIYFENVSTASAPAQEVFINTYLDGDLDWNSLKFTEIAFGDQVVAPVESSPGQFYARLPVRDYRPEVLNTWWVDITAQVNRLTGLVNWTFRMLDPETGLLPADALAGFLPPNDSSGRGEGLVSYSIKARADAPDGARLEGVARITFDLNAPIDTNTVWNTIGNPYFMVYLPLAIRR